jgi:hypothetical protein
MPVVKQAPVKGRTAIKVNFVLPKDAVAGKVSVVGDFNGWDPFAHPLQPRRNGTRSAVVTLPPGAGSRSATWPRAAAGTTTTPGPLSPTASAATTPSSTPSFNEHGDQPAGWSGWLRR